MAAWSLAVLRMVTEVPQRVVLTAPSSGCKAKPEIRPPRWASMISGVRARTVRHAWLHWFPPAVLRAKGVGAEAAKASQSEEGVTGRKTGLRDE